SRLFVITDPARLWVLLDVSEKDLPSIRPGKPVAVQTRAFPERVFRGRTEVISDFLDPTTRTVKVRASIDNSERLLKAEMFVTVALPAHQPPGPDIPAKAVFLRGGRHHVFVERRPGELVRREIRARPQHDAKGPVLDGL